MSVAYSEYAIRKIPPNRKGKLTNTQRPTANHENLISLFNFLLLVLKPRASLWLGTIEAAASLPQIDRQWKVTSQPIDTVVEIDETFFAMLVDEVDTVRLKSRHGTMN